MVAEIWVIVAAAVLLDDFAGGARLLGVGTGGVLAWFRAPLLVVIIAAAAVTAVVRALTGGAT